MSDDKQTLETPALSTTVLSHGHILHSLLAKPHPDSDQQHDLLVGFANPDDHHHSVARSFFNAAVGRYANRLPSGELKLASGAVMHLPGAAGVCLHGGESGFDTLPWTPIARPDSSLFPAEDQDHVVPPPASDPAAPITESSSLHRLYSPAGADGFPCSLEVEALVTVLAPKEGETRVEGRKGRTLGTAKVVFRAKIREDGDEGIKKGTPINLTMHWGFRLDNDRDPNVLGHRLYLASDKAVTLDEQGLSTGEVAEIKAGSELDFYSEGLEGEHRTIGERYPKGGIDRNFLFKTPPPSLIRPTGSARLSTQPQAILTSPAAPSSTPQYQLRFTSNQPSVQVYTASSLDSTGPARKAARGSSSTNSTLNNADVEHPSAQDDEGEGVGVGYPKDGAIFLEFHAPVGAFLHAQRSSGKEQTSLGRFMEERAKERKALDEGRGWEVDSVLNKGEVYENWVEVEVVVLD
ncbi:hypothetical protein JCM11641_005114 [Rhodosporidiobolus odoratus]